MLMASSPRLGKLEVQIMRALWARGALSIREIQETFPARTRPAYTTVQTVVYRLEAKKALRRVKKISNAHIFEAVLSRSAVQRRQVADFLALFGGRIQSAMVQLVETGNLTIKDVEELEKLVRAAGKKDAPK